MPSRMTRAATSSDVQEGKLFSTTVEGTKVLMSRIGGRVHAVVDRCPHMGMSLAKGRLEQGVVTCPWHNSRFDFCTGRNLDWVSAVMGVPMPGWTHRLIAMGKSPAPLTVLTVEESGGEVLVALG